MSRNKCLALFALVLWLHAPALGESLISNERIQAETQHQARTVTAAPSTFSLTYQEQASEFYPASIFLRFEGESARFGKFLVTAKEEVKAGDVLATLILEEDPVALAGKQQALVRAREALARETEAQQLAIEKQLQTLADLSDALEKELAALHIRRAQVALEQYQAQQERLIAALEKEIAQMEEAGVAATLIAPFDGFVTSVNHKRAEQVVEKGEALITLEKQEGMLLRIPNASGRFRYGMQVDVQVGPASNRTMLKGEIVASDELLPQQVRTGYACVKLDPASGTYQSLRVPPSVSAAGVYAQGVFVVPSRALKIENGKYYVQKLQDGVKIKRCVTPAVQDVLNTWVLDGVQGGDVIILD